MPFLVSAALWSGFAAAQYPTSTRDRVTTPIAPSRSELVRTDALLRDMAACVIRRVSIRARGLIDTVPGSHAERRVLNSFQPHMEPCYDYPRNGGRSLGLTLNLLRAAIAELYYHREFGEGLEPAVGVPPEQAEAWAHARRVDTGATQSEGLHAMARCATVRQPRIVRDLLAAPPLSPAEAGGFAALRADLANCLDAGVELTASRQSLRGLLAEAAFHYAVARRGGLETLAGRTIRLTAQ